jgi:tetratricopeptide (TPR) repeat protein
MERRSPGIKSTMLFAFLAGLLVRIVYLLFFRESPFFDGLIVDAQWHDEWARGWADGTWSMGGRAFFRAPLYPLVLSWIYRLFGRNLMMVRLAQAVVGSGTAAALAGCGWRIGGKRMALWAGAIAVLYGPFVFFDAELLIPNLFIALLSWSLFFILSPPPMISYCAAAVFLGMAVIARPNAVVIIPVMMAVIAARIRSGKNIPKRILIIFTVLALIPAAVVTIINARQEGAFVFVASQGGVNLYAGNNPEATGRTVIVPEMRHRQTGWANFAQLSYDVAEETEGRELDSGEVSNFWAGKAFDWVKSEPLDAALLTAKKTYFVINAHEVANNRDPYLNSSFPLNILLWKLPWFAFPWGLIFPIALIGAILGVRDEETRNGIRLLLGWLIVYAAFLLPFFITARFRMGLVPAVILLAAYAVSRGRGIVRPVPLAVGVVALIVVNTNFFEARGGNIAQEKAKLGAALLLDNKLAESRRILEEAVAADPSSADYIFMLGQVYFLENRYENALNQFNQAIELAPTNYRILYYIGNALLHLGDTADAIAALNKAAELHGTDGEVWSSLGRAHELRGDEAEAIESYRRAVRSDPANEQWCLDLGYLFQEREELDAAIETWRTGVEHNPGSYSLHFNLAVAYAQVEQFLKALEHVDKALNNRPNDQNAEQLRGWITQRIGRIR